MIKARHIFAALAVAGAFAVAAHVLQPTPVEAQSAFGVLGTNQRWIHAGAITAASVQSDGGTNTITLPTLPSSMTGLVISETMLNEKTAFVHTTNDGGAQTLVLDIGKSGALERYAKDVSLKQTAGTRTLGSGTTSVAVRNFELAGVAPVVTIVSGDQADALSRVSAGHVDVYFLVENAPPTN